MKAIILAGGEGTRLRPLSLRKPKPMLPFFGRPLLEHLVVLLRSCGFTELCMTLHYLPELIRGHFGSGEGFGVGIEYRTETVPAGTAGSVLACRDFIGGDDVLILSGDAACSFDLRAMMEKHRLSGADATILTQPCLSPAEYGLVVTDEAGRIRSFVEKPGPERIVSDRVNTGIYVISPQVLSRIPRGRSCDFGGELFPLLLREKRYLGTWEPEGYWNDVGTCEAYRQSCRDVLGGLLPLPALSREEQRFSGGSWVSPEAEVAKGAVIGPGSVVGPGSRIGEGCRVTDSVLNGAVLEPECTVEGAILEKGVLLGRGTAAESGCVLAEGVAVGALSSLRSGVRLWPGVLIPEGSTVAQSVTHSARFYRPGFSQGAVLCGEAVRELTPELLTRMGMASSCSRIAASAAGGGYARLLADAFLLGAAAAGRRTYRMDAPLPALGALAGSLFGMDLTLFVRQEGGGVRLYFTGPESLPAGRKEQRSLEAAACSDAAPAPADRCLPSLWLTGAEEAASASLLASAGSLKGLRLACADRCLRGLLLRAGAELVQPEAGVVRLFLSGDGFRLSALDEEGRRRSWEELLCALVKAELQSGAEAVVLPYSAPEAAERAAREENGTVYRLERDGEDALRLFRQRPWCRDGLSLALRLLGLLAGREEPFSLSGFLASLPDFHLSERALHTEGPDASVLRRLAREETAEVVSGVRLREDGCTATVRRGTAGELRILAEAASAELAEEFCARLERRIRALDRNGSEAFPP